MKPSRDRTVVHVRDLADQPAHPLIFVVGGPIRNYISVDTVTIQDGAVVGFRDGALVAMCPLHGSWGVMHRELLELVTLADSLKSQSEEHKSLSELVEEIGGVVIDTKAEAAVDDLVAGRNTYL